MAQTCLKRLILHKQTVIHNCLQAKPPISLACASFMNWNRMSKIGVYEYDRKSGYKYWNTMTLKEKIVEGYKMFPGELKKFWGEAKDTFLQDRIVIHQLDGDYEMFWKFNGEDSLKHWIVTTDHDNLEGNSRAQLTVSPTNRALFHGYLRTEVPKDGILTRTGYCNLRSPYNVKSFSRLIPYDWSIFTHIVLRFRGDGRPYMLVIQMEYEFDIMWNIQFNYPLFTRGGPYWQTAKIPLSKFYSAYKGRIQDKQYPIDKLRVRCFSITMADGVEGPFKLELDYISLYYDANHTEEFAYEMFESKPHMVGT